MQMEKSLRVGMRVKAAAPFLIHAGLVNAIIARAQVETFIVECQRRSGETESSKKLVLLDS